MKRLLLPTLLLLSTAATAQVGIGTTTPHAPLQFGNTAVNRKVVLFEANNNDHQFYGLGINNLTMRYQVDIPQSDHVFFAGLSSTSSQELMRIKGTGIVGIGTSMPDTNAILDLSSTSKSLLMPRLTTAAMNNMAGPAAGMIVFNIDSGKFFGYGSRGSNSPLVNQGTVTATGANPSFAQSFQVSTANRMDAVSFYAASPSPSAQTLSVSLLSGDGISGAVIATATATVPGNTYTLVRATFPASINLQANTSYTFKITPSGPSVGTSLDVYVGTGYANGTLYDAAGSNLGGGYDLTFTVLRGNHSWHALD